MNVGAWCGSFPSCLTDLLRAKPKRFYVIWHPNYTRQWLIFVRCGPSVICWASSVLQRHLLSIATLSPFCIQRKCVGNIKSLHLSAVPRVYFFHCTERESTGRIMESLLIVRPLTFWLVIGQTRHKSHQKDKRSVLCCPSEPACT